MVEFNPQYCPLQKKGTRKFQVNPAYIVNDSQFSDYLSRPVKLKTLKEKSIAKLFWRNPSFSHQGAASLPRDLRQEIFNVIEREKLLQTQQKFLPRCVPSVADILLQRQVGVARVPGQPLEPAGVPPPGHLGHPPPRHQAARAPVQ